MNGSGVSATPLGLLQLTAIPYVAIAAASGGNGGAIALADLVGLEAAVGSRDGDAAADSRMGFVTSPAMRSKLRRTDQGTAASGINLWKDNQSLLGYPAFSTTSVPSNLTQGSGTNLSAIIYGNWADFALQLFSLVDVVINPFLQSVSGVVRVSAFLDVDMGPRHTGSFAIAAGAITV